MKLFHGTSEYAAREAMRKGLLPRSRTGENNWEHTISSHPDAVYLTDTYAAHYACNARLHAPRLRVEGKLSKRVAVIEVEASKLVFTKLRADDDFLIHRDSLLNKPPESTTDQVKRWAAIRDRPTHEWRESLRFLGTCAYHGVVPVGAITRIAFFDPRANQTMAMAMSDAVISPLSFKVCGHIHKACTAWLFGETVTPEDFGVTAEHEQFMPGRYEHWKQAVGDRSGIEIVEVSKAKMAA